jgi:hypothetical protein
MTRLATAACAYAARGIAVFPLMAREKKPYWHSTGLLAASADVELTEARWLRGEPLPLNPDAVEKALAEGKRPPAPPRPTPASNIGIATGPSARFWVLDVDGPEGVAALAALEAVNAPLPKTPEQRTARGRHICFAWPDPAEIGFEIRNSASKLGDKLDVRGAGGYIVAAPSLHPGDKEKGVPPGFEYRWAEGLSPWSIDFAPAPAMADRGAPRDLGVCSAGGLDSVRAPQAAQDRGRARDALRRKGPDERGERHPHGRAGNAERNCVLEVLQHRPPCRRRRDRARLCGARACRLGPGDGGGARQSPDPQGDLGRGPPGHGSRRGQSRPIARPAARAPRSPRARRSRDPRPTRRSRSATRAVCGRRGARLRCRRSCNGSPIAASTSPSLPDALDGLRVHPAAPWNDSGLVGPSLIAPLVKRKGDPVDSLAVLALHEDCERFCHFLGETDGRAVLLSGWQWDVLPILCAIDLQDAWALGAHAKRAGDPYRVAVAPTLRSFAGGILGDRFGRVDPDGPRADPHDPAWSMRALGVVLAVRTDLRTPEFKVRGPGGRSVSRRLEGGDAARFWGSVAEQHWRKAGANAVRILQPRAGDGFNSHVE